MKSIGQLFSRVAPDQRAAQALAIVTRVVLAAQPNLQPDDARATSLRRGQVTIAVKHPAISATIQRHQPEILRTANTKLRDQGIQITELLFRVTE
jgi:hypothetical protein